MKIWIILSFDAFRSMLYKIVLIIEFEVFLIPVIRYLVQKSIPYINNPAIYR